LFGICLLLLLARLPAAEPFSVQAVVLLKQYGAGPGAFTPMPVPVI
jgi:hypothetical protein